MVCCLLPSFPLWGALPLSTSFSRDTVSLLLLLLISHAFLLANTSAIPSGRHGPYDATSQSSVPPMPRPSLHASTHGCLESERTALLQFKAGLHDPNGRLSSWRGLDCCRWAGVACDNFTGPVVKVDLSSGIPELGLLSGKIDHSLLQLKSLQHLDLSGNSFLHIPIPGFIGSFRKLRYLNLSHSGFAGAVPPQLGNLSSLQHLDLSCDIFNDEACGLLRVDGLQWASGLSSLRYLALESVDLSTVGPDWVHLLSERLPFLAELHLPHCNLGSLPSSLETYPNFTSLKVIDVRTNLFYSRIPNWLTNISSLMRIDVSNNSLYGPIPVGFSELPYLEDLDLGMNSNLTANISELFRHGGWRRINTLRLYESGLYGEIPASIGNITSLAWLDLSSNYIGGRIPSSIGKLPQLTELDLANNNITGELLPIFQQSSELTYLIVSSNRFTGIVTDLHFSSLSKLETLALGGNSLILNISSDWIPPFQLRNLLLESCQVGPAFPSWIKSQRELEQIVLSENGISDELSTCVRDILPSKHTLIWLDLSGNNLTGGIPTSIGEMRSLRVLYLYKNNLTGNIPMSIGELYRLMELCLWENKLTGGIPTSITELHHLWLVNLSKNNLTGVISISIREWRHLWGLDLSENSLTGSIPTTLLNSSSLMFLNLGGNRLSGAIPKSPGALMENLKGLQLSGNMLSGEFPSLIRDLPSLEFLDLAYNRFHGGIPTWIENVQTLGILRLRSNRFSGEIPPQLANLKSLQVLDIADNNLSGSIPVQLGGLRGMFHPTKRYTTESMDAYNGSLIIHTKGLDLQFVVDTTLLITSIDLSNNRLSGEFPRSLVNLSGLIGLNLSRNFLTETIPERVGDMHALESLDLSDNYFTGRIPPSMGSMTFLSVLDLSNNNFSGEIPAGGQLDTLENAFLGNPYLCGSVLHRSCSRDDPHQEDINKNEESFEYDWLYMGLGIGFAFGLLTPFLIILARRTWSEAYFEVVDKIIRWLS